ncbi:MAG: hypothetical protein E2O58_12625 [Gammaproteobacteria bacterium]|nr:MAG: hypothetical protein E2O58_12625 [Gammaproteobacteria bacterium]
MKSFLCDLILSCTLVAQPVTLVEDLYYGTVLYAYYQDDFQQALLDTLVAERLERRGQDVVRFELAKGSFAFADGMYRYAEQTFADLQADQLTGLDSMRLTFHLAREHFRREDFARAGNDLQAIDLGKTWFGRERFHPEVEFMRAELATQAGDFDGARRAIQRIDETDGLRAYALFNLGVGLRAAGRLQQAETAFQQLGETPAYDSETLDLQQRAQLALAFVKRERSEPASAEAILGDLPAAGRYRDLALTSYGGLAMDRGDYRLAARIWMSLQQEDYWTESTATARLAFPMSLEQMASGELALIEYRAAERSFEGRLDELTALSMRADDPRWVGGLLKVFAPPEHSSAEMNDVVARWRAELGHTDWLQWLSTERVHELLLEWDELNGIADWLEDLPEQLAIFDALANEQQRRARTAGQQIETNGLAENRERLGKTIRAVHSSLVALRAVPPSRTSDWMFRLADPAQRELLMQLQMQRQRVHRLPEGQRDPWIERIDRLEGLVFWDLIDQSSQRTRALEKLVRDDTRALAEVDARIVRVRTAEEALVAGVKMDFLAFQTRADAITRSVGVALAQREAMLGKELKAGMAREIRQVQHHLLVTRIAIARATDRLAMSEPW